MDQPEIKKTCIPIFSNRLAGELMSKNFVLIDLKKNVRQPERNVYFFVDSPQIQAEISRYKAQV